MTYRPDIDGLRSLAVLSVIISHALPSALPGGFLGVDVFFVISGYLIASLVLREISEERFSFASFYARRVRRLMPAFIVVMVATLLAGIALLLPGELKRTAVSVFAATFSISNYHFAANTGYFDADASLDPALHTWSLAVEEQYYLIFPALAVLLWRKIPHLFPWLLLIVALASLAWADRVATHKPDIAYFALWTRAWELLLGACLGAAVAQGWQGIRSTLLRNALALISIGALAWSFWGFDGTMHHPGYATLVPVLATLTLIASGTNSTLVARGLSLRPFVFVGLLSYSAYLWHQPIIAFHATLFGKADNFQLGSALVLASLIAGYLSWRFIERPTRHIALSNRGTFRAFILSIVALSGLGLAIIVTDGLHGRVSDRVLAIETHTSPEKRAARACNIIDSKDFDPADLCRHGSQPAQVALWGDSHATAMSAGFLRVDPEFGYYQAGVSGCKLVTEHYRSGWRAGCAGTQAKIRDFLLSSPEIRTVIFAGRWAVPGHGHLTMEDETADPAAVIAEAPRLMREMAQAGKRVIVIDPVPEFPLHVPSAVARATWLLGEDRAPVSMSLEDYEARTSHVEEMFSKLAREGVIERAPVRDFFCEQGEDARCVAERNGTPLYFDDDHVGAEGAAPIARRVLDMLDASP